MTCSRNSDELKNCITEWHSLGLDVDGVVADISTADGRQTLVNEIYEWLSENKDTKGVKDDDVGSRKKRKKKKIKQKKNSEQLQLDILVNNVGTNIRKPTIEYTQEEILKVFDTNFFSMYALTIACHPLLKRTPKQMKDLSSTGGSKRSSVVNIGSVAGVTCIKSGSPYASTKAAMNQLTGNLVRPKTMTSSISLSLCVCVCLFVYLHYCIPSTIINTFLSRIVLHICYHTYTYATTIMKK